MNTIIVDIFIINKNILISNCYLNLVKLVIILKVIIIIVVISFLFLSYFSRYIPIKSMNKSQFWYRFILIWILYSSS